MTSLLDSELVLAGLAIGVLTSAPVGPVNVMVIRRALHYGFWPGFFSGLGAVFADGLFAAAAAFGIAAVVLVVDDYFTIIELVGGLLLLVFGVSVMRSHPHLEGQDRPRSIARGSIAAFFMTIANPGTFLGFVAIFGSLGSLALKPDDPEATGLLVLAVMAGAVCWWAFLSFTAARLRVAIKDEWLVWINRCAGGLLLLFSGVILLRAFWNIAVHMKWL
ncbi:LysE family translocator [Pseudovibrio flavus]|uniref:LysE family translocator n=1 Tax=Pseudovibrio flavus TaxID=2529854 RepID=UPI0035279EED